MSSREVIRRPLLTLVVYLWRHQDNREENMQNKQTRSTLDRGAMSPRRFMPGLLGLTSLPLLCLYASAQDACNQIKEACQRAGFVYGGAKAGNGVDVDCYWPITQCKSQPMQATLPLPKIDPQLVAACTGKPCSGGVDASPAAQAPPPNADLWKRCLSQQSNDALDACSRIIDSNTESGVRLAQAYNLRAVIHQSRGQQDEAIADFSRGIQLMQDAGKSGWELAFLYFMRANTYRAKGDLDQAIIDHTESIRIAPGWDKSYNDRGAIYFQKGDVARALADISKVISFRPNDPRVAASYAIRATLLRRMGEPAKGLVDADRAVELAPRSAMALYVRARMYDALGRMEEAEADKRAALAIDPNIGSSMEAMERIKP
jgi:tetratricopeptide (TPR) repeat protein